MLRLLGIGLCCHQKSPVFYRQTKELQSAQAQGSLCTGLLCHQKSRIVYRLSKEPYRALVQSSFPALYHILFHQRFLFSWLHHKSPIVTRLSKDPYRALAQGFSPAMYHIVFLLEIFRLFHMSPMLCCKCLTYRRDSYHLTFMSVEPSFQVTRA